MPDPDLKPSASDPAAPAPPETFNIIIHGNDHIPEALGFLKEWVTALITLQTAAIGAIGTFLALEPQTKLSMVQISALVVTLIAFFTSIYCGGTILHMLPGCAQRTMSDDTRDIYALSTYGNKTIGFWAPKFWYSFVAGLAFFVVFIVVRTLKI